MTTPREYREFARQCTLFAAKAETDEDQKDLLDMACAWTLVALRLEREAQEADAIRRRA
jgi:hypothetical protein